MSSAWWGPETLLELYDKLLKGELGIDVHGKIMLQLGERCKEIKQWFKCQQSWPDASILLAGHDYTAEL